MGGMNGVVHKYEENLEGGRANLYKNPPRRLIRTSAWCRGVTSQQ